MTAPAEALSRLLCAVGLGGVLGLLYGLLRPLRPRHLGDVFFLIGFG